MPDWLTWDWFWQWLGRAADVVSLVALPYAALKVRLIARRVVFRVRAAEMLDRLEKEVNRLKDAMEQLPEGVTETQLQVRRCLELVQIVSTQSGASEQRIAKEIAKHKSELDQLLSVGNHNEAVRVAWSFVYALEAFMIHAGEAQENRRVGGTDVE